MIEVDLSIWINKIPYQNEKPTNAAQDDDNLKKQKKQTKNEEANLCG
jgi:hypothetical protein